METEDYVVLATRSVSYDLFSEVDYLSFDKGDAIYVMSETQRGWFYGKLKKTNNEYGYFRITYTKPIITKTNQKFVTKMNKLIDEIINNTGIADIGHNMFFHNKQYELLFFGYIADIIDNNYKLKIPMDIYKTWLSSFKPKHTDLWDNNLNLYSSNILNIDSNTNIIKRIHKKDGSYYNIYGAFIYDSKTVNHKIWKIKLIETDSVKGFYSFIIGVINVSFINENDLFERENKTHFATYNYNENHMNLHGYGIHATTGNLVIGDTNHRVNIFRSDKLFIPDYSLKNNDILKMKLEGNNKQYAQLSFAKNNEEDFKVAFDNIPINHNAKYKLAIAISDFDTVQLIQ